MANQFKTLFKNLRKMVDVVEFKDTVTNFAKVVIAANNVKLAKQFIKESNFACYDLDDELFESFRAIFINSKDDEYCWWFINYFENPDIILFKSIFNTSVYKYKYENLLRKLKEEEFNILQEKNNCKSYYFCFNNPNFANIQAHEQVLIDSADCNYINNFAQIPGANIKALQDKILKDGSEYDKFSFLKCVKGADVSAFKDVFEEDNHIKYYNDLVNNQS